MKKSTKRKAVAPPPLSQREQDREAARRQLRRTLAREQSIRALLRRVKGVADRRDADFLALTRQLMDYCGIVEAEPPGPPSDEETTF